MRFFCGTVLHCVLAIALGLNGHQLTGPELLSSADTSGNKVDSNQQTCHNVIQPVSFVQKLTHPWTGNYEHNTLCQEIAVLKNTADPSVCGSLHLMMFLYVCFGLLCGFGCFMLCGPAGLCFILVPLAVTWYYLISTGLLNDYTSGAMSWQVNFTKGLQPHNVSVQCLQLVSFTYIMTLIITFYIVLFGCFFGLPMFVVSRMTAERHMTQPFLEKEDKEYVSSKDFEVKCRKAFNEADADHNGSLDMNELEHVLLFDLTDAEKQYVQESSLWKEAFEKCDADGSKTIDQGEFVEVMKFIYTKAKYGAKKAEP